MMILGHKHWVMEEGLQSAWLYETLSPRVDELVVAGITTSRGPKGDNSANRIIDVVLGTEFDFVRINMGGSGAVDNIVAINPIPEPSAALLFAIGVVTVGRGFRR
jgi:hypothetical protein